jgi:hypothetical protein
MDISSMSNSPSQIDNWYPTVHQFALDVGSKLNKSNFTKLLEVLQVGNIVTKSSIAGVPSFMHIKTFSTSVAVLAASAQSLGLSFSGNPAAVSMDLTRPVSTAIFLSALPLYWGESRGVYSNWMFVTMEIDVWINNNNNNNNNKTNTNSTSNKHNTMFTHSDSDNGKWNGGNRPSRSEQFLSNAVTAVTPVTAVTTVTAVTSDQAKQEQEQEQDRKHPTQLQARPEQEQFLTGARQPEQEDRSKTGPDTTEADRTTSIIRSQHSDHEALSIPKPTPEETLTRPEHRSRDRSMRRQVEQLQQGRVHPLQIAAQHNTTHRLDLAMITNQDVLPWQIPAVRSE